MPLIIIEGLDKSGKSMLTNILRAKYNACLIRKQYSSDLYPIDFSKASEYDWQAILDRVVLANPDLVFIADRSFFTQTLYQMSFGSAEHAANSAQLTAFNNYCEVLSKMPHCIIYCHSVRYELDFMVNSMQKHKNLHELYMSSFNRLHKDKSVNVMYADMDKDTMAERLKQITNFIHTSISI
jgi:thymidylate kinase